MKREAIKSSLLSILHLGYNPTNFAFTNRPEVESIEFALDSLQQVGAVDGTGPNPVFTELGQRMSELPIDINVQFAKAIFVASELGIAEEVCSLAALLEQQGNMSVGDEKGG